MPVSSLNLKHLFFFSDIEVAWITFLSTLNVSNVEACRAKIAISEESKNRYFDFLIVQ